MAKTHVILWEKVATSICDYHDSSNQISCVLSYAHGVRYWKRTHQALLHPSKLARNHLSSMKSYENMRPVWYTDHHFFIVGGVHSLSLCLPSQVMPCNYLSFYPSSSTILSITFFSICFTSRLCRNL